MVDISCLITCAKFGDDQLRDLGVAGGQILPFSVDFDRVSYNTHPRTTVRVCDKGIMSPA